MVANPLAEKTSDSPSEQSSLPLDIVHRQSDREAREPMRKWKFVTFGSLLIIGGLAGAILLAANEPDSARQPAVPTVIRSRVVALGRLEPMGEIVEVWGPGGSGDARIQEVKVSLGQRVAQGDELVRLDNYEIAQAHIMVAEAKQVQAEQKLKQTQIVTELTREQMQAAMESREADFQLAESHYWRQQKLAQSNVITIAELDESKQQREVARTGLQEAKSKLARYASQNESSIDVDLAKADLLVAQASLEEARVQLLQSIVEAPVDGTVLQIMARAGQRVNQGPILKMGNTNEMFVRAEVYESDIDQLHLEFRASLESPAIPQKLQGTICEIGSLVQRQSVVDSLPAANTDARVVEVLIRLDEESSAIASRYIGLQGKVEFVLHD